MRTAPLLLVLIVGLLAGCAQPTTPSSAAAPKAIACEPGRVMTGLDGNGAPTCGGTPYAGFRCPAGEAVVGFGYDGSPVCASLAPISPVPSPWTPPSAGSALKMIDVYGARPNASSDLDRFRVDLELAAGSLPIDMTRTILRFSDGVHLVNEVAGGDGVGTFQPTWIRGTGTRSVMQDGDLVEVAFHVADAVPPRTAVTLAIVPEIGSPVEADFKTPATYGSDTTITLR